MTQDEVRSLFTYKDNGTLIRRTDGGRHNNKIGQVAGGHCGEGYHKVRVGGERHRVHRVVFLYHNGYLPDYIDHIDGNPSNNKIDNLRECTIQQNTFNSKLSKSNTSGFKGVHWRKDRSRWVARVKLNGKLYSAGSYKDINDAFEAVKIKRIELHGEFANSGIVNA